MSNVIGVVTDKGLLKVTDANGVLKIGDVIIPQKKLKLEGSFNGNVMSNTEFYVAFGEKYPNTFVANKHYEVHGTLLGNFFTFRFLTDKNRGVHNSDIRRMRCYASDGYPKSFDITVSTVSGVTIRFGIGFSPDGATIDGSNTNNVITVTKIYEIIE